MCWCVPAFAEVEFQGLQSAADLRGFVRVGLRESTPVGRGLGAEFRMNCDKAVTFPAPIPKQYGRGQSHDKRVTSAVPSKRPKYKHVASMPRDRSRSC